MRQEVSSDRLTKKVVADVHIGIVVSRFNKEISDGLFAGCQRALQNMGVARQNINTIFVPGAFELPFAAKKLIDAGRYQGLICIGAVIRGDTPHFDFVAGESARGIMELNLLGKIPVIFGVITCNNLEQAKVRSAADNSNKGYEAGVAALEMIEVFSQKI